MPDIDNIQHKILTDYIEQVKLAIIKSQNTLSPPLKASGNLQRSMKVIKGSHSDTAFLSADNYLSTTFAGVGIKKGTIFPYRQLIQWLRFKNISGVRDERGRFMPRKTIAYLMARKIWLEGSGVSRGTRPGVPINKILKQQLPATGRKLAQAYARDFANDVKKEL